MEEYKPKYIFVYMHDTESAIMSIRADTEEEAEAVLGKLVFWFDDWTLSEKEPIIYDEEILEVPK